MRYVVIYERGPTSYSAYIPDLPGCVAAAKTFEEAKRLIRETVKLHLEGLRAQGDPVPPPTSVAEYVELAP